ncbi:hypothetical protein QA596_02415 [Balneolales bacterium ANBcel1]|nr:hypothetical protein [Balneolales bacterium ANBcel1]
MKFISDIHQDARHPKTLPQSFEWWYFDGISEEGDYRLAITFYDGYPFVSDGFGEPGTRGELADSASEQLGYRPAVGIVLYHRGKRVFSCLNRYDADEATFSESTPAAEIAGNSFRFEQRQKHGNREYGVFDIRINMAGKSGEELKGIVTLAGLYPNNKLLVNGNGKSAEGNCCNLALPCATLQCRISLTRNGLVRREMQFNGTGCHYHHLRSGPAAGRYREWYQGRVHFPQATLIYSLSKGKKEKECHAWLVSPDNRRLLHTLSAEAMYRRRPNRYLHWPAHAFRFRDGDIRVSVSHNQLLETGRRLCRYSSEAVLEHPGIGRATASGAGAYMRHIL